jgi:hypothetical protein
MSGVAQLLADRLVDQAGVFGPGMPASRVAESTMHSSSSRQWNHDFTDLPLIEKQYRPTFTAETMSTIVQKAAGQEQALLIGTWSRFR